MRVAVAGRNVLLRREILRGLLEPTKQNLDGVSVDPGCRFEIRYVLALHVIDAHAIATLFEGRDELADAALPDFHAHPGVGDERTIAVARRELDGECGFRPSRTAKSSAF